MAPDTTDANSVYTYAIMHSMSQGGRVAETFEAARDSKTPKMFLMAAVLAGWMAATNLIHEKASSG